MRLAVAAVAVAGSFAVTAPASATECTPRGCTGGCYVNPSFGTGDPRPILCYS